MLKSIFVTMIAMVICVLNLNSTSALAKPKVDAKARTTATAAFDKAGKATTAASNADAKAAAANTAAANADRKAGAAQITADAANTAATKAGTDAAIALAAKEAQLKTLVSQARGAAFSGDRRLEKKLDSEVAALKAEIKELSLHPCAAFKDTAVQTACITSFQSQNQNNNEMALNIVKDNNLVQNTLTEKTFDHANQRLDMVKAIQLGCIPRSTTTNGTTVTEFDCAQGHKGPAMSYEFKDINKFGFSSVKVAPATHSFTWGKYIVAGLSGGVAGSGMGYALYPNQDHTDSGRSITRHWEGPIGGAAVGTIVGVAVVAAYDWATN